jgi:hypothetical protein
MSTLLVHVISDFLRDQPPQANQMGEPFRCAVLDDENTALQNYGCSQYQIGVLTSRNRAAFLQALSQEIGAVMDELDNVAGVALNYPGGKVRLKEAKVLASAPGNNRYIAIRGDGLAGTIGVSFQSGGGNPIQGTVAQRTCDRDVWQRLFVTATLPVGNYTVTVNSGGAAGNGTTATISLTVS